MPYGDGTGPNGMGPMTGRAAGYCAGFNTPGFANPMAGRGGGMGFGGGFGRGRGGGGGRRNMFNAARMPGWPQVAGAWNPAPVQPAAPTREQQVEALKAQAGSLENALTQIRSQLTELEKE